MKTLLLESVAGVAGDMFVAAFIDAKLVSADELQLVLDSLKIPSVKIVVSHPLKALMHTTHVAIEFSSTAAQEVFRHSQETGPHQHFVAVEPQPLFKNSNHGPTHWHTHFNDIVNFINQSALNEKVKARALNIFSLIGSAESRAHGIELNQVAFHEVGTIDSIADVVLAAYCIEKTAAQKFLATPIKPGRGLVTMAHGTHPVPPPASAILLESMQIAMVPQAIQREHVELSTPTGIAILKSLNPQFVLGLPNGKVLAQGSGAGKMDLASYPNIFRIHVIQEQDVALPYFSDSVYKVECNLDDETGERLGWLTQKIWQLKPLDVWMVSALGKKGRPLQVLSILVNEEYLNLVVNFLLVESTTFGVRYQKYDRFKLKPEFTQREVDGQTVTIKSGYDLNGKKIKEKIEFDSRFN